MVIMIINKNGYCVVVVVAVVAVVVVMAINHGIKKKNLHKLTSRTAPKKMMPQLPRDGRQGLADGQFQGLPVAWVIKWVWINTY